MNEATESRRDAHSAGRPPSRRSRLVEGAVTVASECPCGHPRVGVLRGFGIAGRSEAAAVRRRLGRRGVAARDLPLAMLAASHEPAADAHVCVFVDLTGERSLEAARVAVLEGVPLVSARRSDRTADEEQVAEDHAALRVVFHGPEHATFPSAVGQVPDVAFDAVRVVPNQPETGELRMGVDDQAPLTLPPGAELCIKPLAGMARVDARPVRGEARTWFARGITLDELSGVHKVYRDDLCIADLDASLSVVAGTNRLVRHLV